MTNDLPAGLLSDTGIRKYFKNGIDIFTDGKDGLSFDLDKQLHIGSVDLRFRHLYHRFSLNKDDILSYELLRDHKYTTPYELSDSEKLIIDPGEIVLATSLEIVSLSEDFAALITGRSSIARLGIMVHCCQDFIHPGHGQAIPLQIINLSPNRVELDMRVPICQIIFFKLASTASEKYTDRADAKYSKEKDAESSKIYQEIESGETSNFSRSGHHNVSVSVNVGAKSEDPSETKKKESKIKKILKKYFKPFLPGIIMAAVGTPLISNYIVNKTVQEVHRTLADAFTDFPAAWVVAIICLFLFIISSRGDNE